MERDANWYTDCKKDSNASSGFNDTICFLFGYGENDKLFQLLENAVGMNNVYFNTGSVAKLNTLPLKKKIKSACAKFTRTLVDEYIHPKRIVTMGVDPFNNLKNKPVEIIKQGDVCIKKSYRGEIPVYNIPNPSRRNRNRYYKEEQIKQYRQIFEREFFVSQ
jgi:hypothetical protein